MVKGEEKNIETPSRDNRRKCLIGEVTSNKTPKTIKVVIKTKCKHARYSKIISKRTVAIAHNELPDVMVGDKVKIIESRPLSKTKRWVVLEKVS